MIKVLLTPLGWVGALALLLMQCTPAGPTLSDYTLYPEVNVDRPALPSPLETKAGEVYLTACTEQEQYALIPVSLSDDRTFGPQLFVDQEDFPHLAKRGLHSERELDRVTTITGRTLEEINRLARPGGLSQGGFIAAEEDVLAVIRGDNHLVRQMGLTHPELATPSFPGLQHDGSRSGVGPLEYGEPPLGAHLLFLLSTTSRCG
jgi:hypothetical protein